MTAAKYVTAGAILLALYVLAASSCEIPFC